MSTKFVICYEESCLAIVATRADAEEYILSLAEEAIYEDYLAEMLCYDEMSHEEYMAEQMFLFQERNDSYHWRPMQTLYGYLLDCASTGFYGYEVRDLT